MVQPLQNITDLVCSRHTTAYVNFQTFSIFIWQAVLHAYHSLEWYISSLKTAEVGFLSLIIKHLNWGNFTWVWYQTSIIRLGLLLLPYYEQTWMTLWEILQILITKFCKAYTPWAMRMVLLCFQLSTLGTFLGKFLHFYTNQNRNKYSTVWLDDITNALHRMSQNFTHELRRRLTIWSSTLLTLPLTGGDVDSQGMSVQKVTILNTAWRQKFQVTQSHVVGLQINRS